MYVISPSKFVVVTSGAPHLDLRAEVFTPFKPSLFAGAESFERGRSSTCTLTLSGPPRRWRVRHAFQ